MSTAHDKYTALQRHRNAGALALDPRSTALVIIDMQEYFVNPASPFSRACEAIVPGVMGHFQERGRGVVEPSLRRLLDFFRSHALRVVYTTVASELPDGSDLMPIFQQRNAANPLGEPLRPNRLEVVAQRNGLAADVRLRFRAVGHGRLVSPRCPGLGTRCYRPAPARRYRGLRRR